MIKIFALLSIFSVSSAWSVAWEGHSSPLILDEKMLLNFDDSITSGSLKDQRLGWPAHHWSNFRGGIAYRWSAANPQNYTYRLNTLSDLKQMESHLINELSPAEKFDIFNSDYNYSLVKSEFKRTSPYESTWHGICHGYAPAAINHPEPATVTVTNAEGVEIKFYSSDVSALMSLFYANSAKSRVRFVGRRCRYNEGQIRWWAKKACEGLNAGTFHVALVNKLGIQGEGFVVDLERYSEVWNHVPTSFNSYYRNLSGPGENSAPGTVSRVQVETVVSYGADIVPKFDPVLNTENADYIYQTYEYYLDLDEDGMIIGGDWISETRPDFIWTQDAASFTGRWSSLNKIFRPHEIKAVEAPENEQ